MEPFLEKVPHSLENSFFVKRDPMPFLDWGWHFHPEFEICLTEKSTGKRFVGNSVENFEEGDLVLLGSMLPHAFVNDPIFKQGRDDLYAQTLVVQFHEQIFGDRFLLLPECRNIKKILERSKYGIQIIGKSRKVIEKELTKLVEMEGLKKLLQLIKILNMIYTTEEYRLLSKGGYVRSYRSSDSGRINAVYNHIVDNFNSEIKLETVASIANLTETAFCKYFKQRTSKSFSRFLNEIRISHSCKLLLDEDLTIKEICEESGFKNLSNYNRQFKKITGKTPREYQKEHRKNILPKIFKA